MRADVRYRDGAVLLIVTEPITEEHKNDRDPERVLVEEIGYRIVAETELVTEAEINERVAAFLKSLAP